ncbi:NifB/NifX family molybdenum-iron cluster-binding protein [Cohaesibacter celericrescens]|nr:NifB/NifX family molybdenum-iron cluster-binding protein [Cohaesibacter celericrescens]
MKIAVTSQNFKTVTNHAGRARRFIVFTVGQDNQPQETERFDLPKDQCIHELGGKKVAHALDGVDVVISASFGPGFARNMASRDVIASLTDETDPVRAVQDYLSNGQRLPSPEGCGEDHHHGSH